MKMQGWMLGWALVGVWLAATPAAAAEDRRREPQKCEERCDDESKRCEEICRKYSDNDACFKACSDEEKRCTQRCKQAARR